MDKYYTMHFGELERHLPLCPISDTLYIAGFIMLGDQKLSEECAKQLAAKMPEHDYIITAEAKGITLAHEMAKITGNTKYFVARKGVKLYMKGNLSVSVRSITTAKEQFLCLDTADAEMMKGKRILIVDDVISTGESLNAIEKLVEKAGGITVGKMAVLAEGDAAERDDIIFLQKLPLFDKEGNPKE